MDLFLAICQGLGVALAVGIGGALAALFVSAMGSLGAGFDPEGSDFSFISETWYLVVLFVILVVAMVGRARASMRYPIIALLSAAGAIGFAASLAEEGETAWWGLIAGAIAAGLAALVATDVLEGAINRARGARPGDAEADAANMLIIVFAFAGIALAALCLFVPPVALAAAVALAIFASARRRKADEKYEGLRVLR